MGGLTGRLVTIGGGHLKKTTILAIIIFLFGCSPPAPPFPKNTDSRWDTEQYQLQAIHVSIYSTKHPNKSQPMLVKSISSNFDLDVMKAWEIKLKSTEKIELSYEDILGIYYLQLEYKKNGVSAYRDFLYITSKGSKSYCKEIKMRQEINYDLFDENSKALLLKTVGLNEWNIIADPLPI